MKNKTFEDKIVTLEMYRRKWYNNNLVLEFRKTMTIGELIANYQENLGFGYFTEFISESLGREEGELTMYEKAKLMNATRINVYHHETGKLLYRFVNGVFSYGTGIGNYRIKIKGL